MDKWQPIETAPHGETIIVWHDHDSDSYHKGEGKLTIYGAWCEGNGYETRSGIYLAKFGGGYSEDASGDGYGPFYNMPDWWFKHDDQDCEHPLAPTHWMPLPCRDKPQ
jgi:hypothetical protein